MTSLSESSLFGVLLELSPEEAFGVLQEKTRHTKNRTKKVLFLEGGKKKNDFQVVKILFLSNRAVIAKT